MPELPAPIAVTITVEFNGFTTAQSRRQWTYAADGYVDWSRRHLVASRLVDAAALAARHDLAVMSHEAIPAAGTPEVAGVSGVDLSGVGRCGDRMYPVFASADLASTCCALPAGHAGWHRSDKGAEWTNAADVRSDPEPGTEEATCDGGNP